LVQVCSTLRGLRSRNPQKVHLHARKWAVSGVSYNNQYTRVVYMQRYRPLSTAQVYFLRVEVGSSLRAVSYQNSRKCTCALESLRFLTRNEFSDIELLYRTAESTRFLDVVVTFCGLKWVVAYAQCHTRTAESVPAPQKVGEFSPELSSLIWNYYTGPQKSSTFYGLGVLSAG
jgi:hypothetical protein